jgi:hypothetical protein
VSRGAVGTEAEGGGRLGSGREGMEENEHPKGALAFILVYLALLSVLWLNAYLRLWGG